MRIVSRISELDHPGSKTTGFVPTMGALHEGHLSLMRHARKASDRVVVSIFVNPTQFGPNEDLSKYPRDLDGDAAKAESVGVDVLFVPSREEMYGNRLATTVHVPEVTDELEGSDRPGHFSGVATVVCKLFNIVRPDVAYFGLKDLQQCVVIRRMVEDLNMGVKLAFLSTVREPDGLAMSSRNAYLTEDERRRAPRIYEEIRCLRDFLVQNKRTDEEVSRQFDESRRALQRDGFVVSYLELVDLATMKPSAQVAAESAIVAAAKLGKTRLIDNLVL